MNTDQVTALRIFCYIPSGSPPYTLQCTRDPVSVHRILWSPVLPQYQSSVLVLHILYNPLEIKFQSSVYTTIHQRHSTSPPYATLSSTDADPESSVDSTVHYRASSSTRCSLQSTTNPEPVFLMIYSSFKTKY